MALQGAQRRPARQVPDLERPVVGAPRRRAGRPASPPPPMTPWHGPEGAQLAPRRQVPDLQRPSSEAETARRPSGVTATALTPAPWPSGAQLRPARQVPDLERPVVGGGDRAPAVRRHRHRPDPSAMAFEGRARPGLPRSQTLSVRSSEPETARRPSGVTATAVTPDRHGPRGCAARDRPAVSASFGSAEAPDDRPACERQPGAPRSPAVARPESAEQLPRKLPRVVIQDMRGQAERTRDPARFAIALGRSRSAIRLLTPATSSFRRSQR